MMGHTLVITPQERMERRNRFSSDFDSAISNRKYIKTLSNSKTVCVDQGFLIWKSILEKHYHRAPASQDWLQFRNSSIWRNGHNHYHSVLDSSQINLLKNCILEGQAQLTEKNLQTKDNQPSTSIENLIQNDSKRNAVIQTLSHSIGAWQNYFLPKNFCLIPWRAFSYTTFPETYSVSQKWHYDMNIPDNVVYFMLNLSDYDESIKSGTAFLSAEQSANLSMHSDYISAPVDFRINDFNELSGVDTHGINAAFYPSTPGQLIAFQPGRALHKGVFNPKDRRDNIHISTTIVSRDTTIEIEHNGSRKTEITDNAIKTCWQFACSEAGNKSNSAPYIEFD